LKRFVIVPCAVETTDPPRQTPTCEELEIINRRVLATITPWDPPRMTRFQTPEERAELHRLRKRVDENVRVTRRQLFNGPSPQPHVDREEGGAVGGEEEKVVGGGEVEEEEALQVLWDDLTISEPAPVANPPALQVAEPPRQDRRIGRGNPLLRERSTSRIGWNRRLEQQM
jgi:hypothetical protein